MQGHGGTNLLTTLSEYKIIPVIRGDSTDNAHLAINSLADIGYQTVEITMTVPGAIDLIKEFAHNDQKLLIGAGTVFNAKEAEESIKAGAKYIVSPCLVDEEVIETCNQSEVPCIMSGLSPTEVYEAWRRGSAAVKVFPAKSMGGPDHLKALKSVFPSIPLVPTGGVNLNNIKQYLQSGAAFVGVGSDLVNNKMLEEGNVEDVKRIGRQFLEQVEEIKLGG